LAAISGQAFSIPAKIQTPDPFAETANQHILADNSIINTLFGVVVWYLKQSY